MTMGNGSPIKQIDPKEEAKQNRRLIDRAHRKIERERKKLELSEKKYLAEIKTLAKQGKHVRIVITFHSPQPR